LSRKRIELLPGNHVVAAKSGAVIVIANRGGARLTESSGAALACTALLGIIDDAAASEGEHFGEAFTRLADRWSSDQSDDVEFAGVAPSLTGLAIYLRGGVGVSFQHPHGSEELLGVKGAPFVDLISLTSGKAAVFVRETEGAPVIPGEPGIGSFVEGVALGAGAVIWLTGDPLENPERTDSTGDTPMTGPMPTPSVELRPPKIFDSFRPNDVPPPLRPPLPPIRKAPPPPPRPAPPQQPPPVQQPPLRGPVRPGPPGPPPPGVHVPPRPQAQQRARPRPPSDRMVRGVLCSEGHLNDPQAQFCRVDGRRMDHTKIIVEGERPALGVLVLDDGAAIVLHGNCVFGREPEASESARRGATPIRLQDRSGRLSRAHAEIRLVEWEVAILDLGSRNGTFVRMPGDHQQRRLAPGSPFTLMPGSEVAIGGRLLNFDSANPRF